jgi:dTDP-glucose 4,6-dehydratase
LGGTGFFGRWITQALFDANIQLELNLELTTLSRGPSQSYPASYRDQIRHISLDLSDSSAVDFQFDADFFIHTATSSKSQMNQELLKKMYACTLNAAKIIIESARKYQNFPSVVHLSSGAVYRKPKTFGELFPERDLVDGEQGNGTLYALAKIETEKLFATAVNESVLRASNPRLFAFTGPGLPLDQHFAIGNFLSCALEGKSIFITGAPETYRSYMSPVDAVLRILTLMVRPTLNPLNIGSSHPISMIQLAKIINSLTGNPKEIVCTGSGLEKNFYAPSTKKTEKYLQLPEPLGVEESISNWINWINSK